MHGRSANTHFSGPRNFSAFLETRVVYFALHTGLVLIWALEEGKKLDVAFDG